MVNWKMSRWLSHDFIACVLGVALLSAQSGAFAVTDSFTTAGTSSWTAPAGVTSVTVEAWGGGGSGGGATGNPAKGGGGAGGQYASKVVTVVPGNTYTVVVGAGGTGSTGNGAAGGDSTFDTNVVIAKGGAGGTGATNGVAGAGSSSGGVGTAVYAGGNGSNGVVTTSCQNGGAGGGGAGSGGVGGNASGNTAGTGTATGGGNGGGGRNSSGDGNAGNTAGGGGGGACAENNTNRNGGNGAAGQVMISYAAIPAITSISPSTQYVGDGAFTMTVNGSNFVATSQVQLNGSNRTTTYISATQLTVSIPASDMTSAGNYSITVVNPAPGGGTSNAVTFTVVNFCTPPSNIPAGLTVSCQCDTFNRATLNPSTIFNSNWIVSTSDSTGILPSIVNQGYLRLTNSTNNNAKAATVPGIFPAAGNYISVEFKQYAYSGSGADGIAVTLSDYSVPAVPGAYGGSLGYAQKTGINGFAGGWLGVAMDEYGNYQNPTEGRTGGPGFIVDSVGARGSGSGTTGYQWLGGTSTLSPAIDNSGSATPAYGYFYQVVVDARGEPTSTTVTVNRDTGSGYTTLINIPNVYTAATAQGFTQSPVPANWQISFTGSTGGSTNIHEIGSVRICASTMVPPSGGSAGSFNAIDEAYGNASVSPGVSVQNYLTGHIYTKLIGTGFKLNVAALSNNQIVTTYAAASAKSVTVKLVDNSDSLADSTKDCTLSCTSTCTSKSAVAGGTQTLTFASGATDKGQKQSGTFTLNTAYQKLVAIISDGTTSACSTDSFAVRPLSVSTVTSSASNASTTGTPIFKAGSDNFSLIATIPGITGNLAGYNGVLKINNNVVQVAGPATVKGTIIGTFPAAVSATPNSTATGMTFTYSEVGGFILPGYDPASDTTSRRSVYDGVATTDECTTPNLTPAQCDTLRAAIWTGVDSISTKGDCVLDSYSNTLNASGKYGCNFGLLPNSTVFGRFVPDHFETAVLYSGGVPLPCASGLTCPTSYNGMVYSGQPFTVQVTAKNAAGNTTVNYNTTTGLSKAVTLTAWDALGSTTSQNPGPGALSNGSVAASAFTGGVGSSSLPSYAFTSSPTLPTAIYLRASDSDGVTSLRATPSSSVEGGVGVVSGRIKLSNAYGSELLPLTITATAQYYKDATNGWVTSSNDSISQFSSKLSSAGGNVQASIVQGPLTLANVSVVSPGTLTLSSGVRSFTLAAPGAGHSGSVDLSMVGAPAWLVPDAIKGRATFGVYKGSNDFIYQREVY